MKRLLWLFSSLLSVMCAGPVSETAKTTFQSSRGWMATIDNRADAVMVYGADTSLDERMASWRERGYEVHFMTGIAWGGYQEYFTGEWDGVPHWDEAQVAVENDTIWHGRKAPYIVPTENFLAYFKERQVKPAIDAGADAIFLEEPEFWARAGYSDAFKREWTEYYGEPWRPQDESPEWTYLSAKLKYHLYYRALEEAFTYAKEYGRSLGRDIKCYVPTHSLVNYSQWQIVSPEASLASLPCVDGYIAQVWTGTSRVLNYFNGVEKERVFESAYLEYGCAASMTAPTGRRLWFLTDPVEDGTRDWDDFRRNYQATFTAQLLYPQVADYEIMPWPERIYGRPYPVAEGSSEKSLIPSAYASQMQVMTNALQQMPKGEPLNRPLAVLMANSLMFQGFPEHDGYTDPRLSGFFGLALPLLKRGQPVGVVHIENLGYPETLKDVKVLLMTYADMKPLEPEAHRHLADWVRRGGNLIYSATDRDPFQRVREWWNTGGNAYKTPSDHLFSLLDVPAGAPEGVYAFGEGKLCVLRKDPQDYVLAAGGDKPLLDAVEALSGPIQETNVLTLSRGPYRIAAVLDEGVSEAAYREEGCFIDLYDPDLPVLDCIDLAPGGRGLYYDVRKAGKGPQILAAASRSYLENRRNRTFSYICKGPANTENVTRILLPSAPGKVLVNGNEHPFTWDSRSRTCFLRFPNDPEGVSVSVLW